MSYEGDKMLGKHLEYILIAIWILVVLVIFFLVNALFLQPLNEAEKRQAQEQIGNLGERR